jgi:predicted flap endonuclease-1-like 5' DNA nuclease
MSIIDTIVSALRSLTGGGTENSTGASESTGPEPRGQVSTEYDPDSEPATPDASTEAAVKGSDVDSEVTDDGVAAGTDATASTGTLVDEEEGKEPAEAVGGAGGVDVDRTADESDIGADGEDTKSGEPDVDGADSVEAAETDDADAAADGSTEPVETVTGIGPAYGGRLAEYGIETVGELAAADAADVAEGIDVSESRVSDWVERANDAS